MAINTGRVVAGGLVAGVVLNVVDFVNNTYIMASQMKADMDKLNPSLWSAMNNGTTIATFIVSDFVYGIILVWLYAAIRPRFGAGAATAIKAGLALWAFGTVIFYGLSAMGMFSSGTFWMAAGISLVQWLLAAYLGAMVYKED